MRPGGHQLRPEVLAHHQRRRIIDGAAAVIAARGYREVSVADIVRSAAIARGRFYEHFASKEDCFFALYEEGTAAALAAVHKGCGSAGGGDFGGRLEAGLAALLAYLEANPEMARCCIVEGPAVGAAIGGRFEATISGFADLLREAREATGGGEDLPGTVEETVVGGLYWLLYYALLERRPKRIGRLLPQLSDFASIPFATATPHEGAALHP